jgi:hypothetical protein
MKDKPEIEDFLKTSFAGKWSVALFSKLSLETLLADNEIPGPPRFTVRHSFGNSVTTSRVWHQSRDSQQDCQRRSCKPDLFVDLYSLVFASP